jgi:hypothetical protein
VKAPPKDLYGELFQFGQDIPEARVYLWNNQNGRLYEEIGVRASGYETVAGTAIHEGLHGLGIGDSRRAEALVRLAELGLLGVPIDVRAMRQVLQDMKDFGGYRNLPWRIQGSSSNFPGLEW